MHLTESPHNRGFLSYERNETTIGQTDIIHLLNQMNCLWFLEIKSNSCVGLCVFGK